MLYYYFIKNEQANRTFVTLFWLNHYGLNTINCQRTLSRHRFSIGRRAKLAGHVQFPTVISHPAMKRMHLKKTLKTVFKFSDVYYINVKVPCTGSNRFLNEMSEVHHSFIS